MAAPPRIVLSKRDCDAAFFDLNGVLTDTARLHAAAWKRLFDAVPRRRATVLREDFLPFNAGHEYLAYVDGRPREVGVRTFLASRGISLPEGSEADPDEAETIAALARHKDDLFALKLEAGVAPMPGAAALLHALRLRGIRSAVVSSSRNCVAVLAAAGLADLVEVRVDGLDALTLGLPGKPAPDMFLEAARRLGVVFEDALAGVEAGRRGGFGRVAGVDRGGQAEALLRQGADVVVHDLSEVAPD